MGGSSDETSKFGPVPDWLALVGGVPLLAAMLVEFASVTGRNTGHPVPGAIELVEALILLSSATAIVVATLSRAHAKVRVLVSRVRGHSGRVLRFLIATGSFVFFSALATGSAWILYDMWSAHEESELLHLPYLPLRLFATACFLLTAALYLRRLVREITHDE